MGSINTNKPLLPTALSSIAVDKPWQHQKTSGTPGIEPGTAWFKARTLPLHYAVPNNFSGCISSINNETFSYRAALKWRQSCSFYSFIDQLTKEREIDFLAIRRLIKFPHQWSPNDQFFDKMLILENLVVPSMLRKNLNDDNSFMKIKAPLIQRITLRYIKNNRIFD